jgi:transposase InsO family protein
MCSYQRAKVEHCHYSVDRLTKYGHFLALSHPYTATTMAQLFMDIVFKLHGPPVAIITDRDRIFTSQLWQQVFKSLKVALHYSTTYHPQSDGQIERVNQCLENYLRCMAFL